MKEVETFSISAYGKDSCSLEFFDANDNVIHEEDGYNGIDTLSQGDSDRVYIKINMKTGKVENFDEIKKELTQYLMGQEEG